MKSYLGFMEDVPSVRGEVLGVGLTANAIDDEVTLRGEVLEVGLTANAIAPTVEPWL